jgi:hypothetical protein
VPSKPHLVSCPSEHPFELVIAENTPNVPQAVYCPTCGHKMMGLLGEVQSVRQIGTARPGGAMRCQEKETLFEEYEKKVVSYSEAVRKMRDYGAALPVAEFQLLYDVALRANELCQSAGRGLRRHVEAHEC